MNRLSALDSLFLYFETPETPMHVGSVTIFKPASHDDDRFRRFREHTAARLDLLPSYRRRLESTPLGIDHPVWVIDQKLDLDYHIRRAVLPKPGGMSELRAIIARLHAVPLDRARPLWEYHFIEGLEDGAFAVYVKVHHAAMDGLAGMATLGATFDFAPGEGREDLAPHPVSADVEPSDGIELASTAIGDFIRQGWRAVRGAPGMLRSLAKIAPNLTRDARFLYSYVREKPRTPFNAMISARRVYATCSLPLAEVKGLAKSRGVTINDLVLALCSGALRRYLADRGSLPDKPLTAGVPASLRPFGDSRLNNQVVFTLSRLPTDVSEPLPRLAAAQRAGQEAKNLFADMRDLFTTNVSLLGAPLVVTAIARLWAGARAANYLPPFFNVVISNVPGPRQTMYCVGAPATHYFPVSIPYHGCALNITVQSYLDQLDFGLIACSDVVPDAQRIADFIADDFAALRQADAAAGRALEGTGATAKPAPPGGGRPTRPPEAASAPMSVGAGEPSFALRIEALGAITEALARKLDERTSLTSRAPRAGKKTAEARRRSGTRPAADESRRGESRAKRRPRSKSGGASKSAGGETET